MSALVPPLNLDLTDEEQVDCYFQQLSDSELASGDQSDIDDMRFFFPCSSLC